MLPSRKQLLAPARRIIVKIGTGVLTAESGGFNRGRFPSLCEELARAAAEREVVVVSSGAIALGVERLGLKGRPRDIPGKQAAAAVGQSRLMRMYDDALSAHGLVVAQVLLTHADIASRPRYLNARHAMQVLLEKRVVPIINENDTVSVEELKFGDNDTLAGMAVDLVEADLLVMLTDTEGLYSADPRADAGAVLLREVERVTPEIERAAGGAPGFVSEHGTGGMLSKVRAAKRAAHAGVPSVIAPGKEPGVLDRVLAGDDVGTMVYPQDPQQKRRKRWIGRDLRPRGTIRVDEGARDAILARGKSLLPSGVKDVAGTFAAGDPVEIALLDGAAFARGLAGYSADEIRKIRGVKTAEIEGVLGYRYLDEVVHRDDLVLI